MRNVHKIKQGLLIMLAGIVLAGFAWPVEAKKVHRIYPGVHRNFTITTQVIGKGRVIPPQAIVRRGVGKVFRMLPGRGYALRDVQLDGYSVFPEVQFGRNGQGIFRLDRVSANHHITAVFVKRPHHRRFQ